MEELLKQMLEKAKSDKKGLCQLKNAAVRLQQFELAANLREIETTNFPESEERKAAKKLAKELQTALGMVKLNVSLDVCWMIHETFKQYNKKKGKFSLMEASKIEVDRMEFFDIEQTESK